MGMELDIWKGDWGLPSIDRQCLTIMAYCKFADIPVTFIKTNNPWKSPTGELPILRSEIVRTTGIDNIFNFFRKENYGIDHDLTSKQSADIIAFSALLEQKLLPALLHQMWVDEQTYVDLIRPWYAKALPLPFNFFLPGQYNRKCKARIDCMFSHKNLTDLEREKLIYKDAKECINMLSSMLGNKDFFFGRMPSTLDAIVFGYLAPLLKIPFSNLALQNHLKCCQNLVHLVNNILQKYFPLTLEEIEELRAKEQESQRKQHSKSGLDDDEFPNRKRNIFLAGLFALTTMASYALLSGLIQIEIVDDDKEPPGKKGNPPDLEQFENLFSEKDEQKEKR